MNLINSTEYDDDTIEEILDDKVMLINDRLFIGSIDAANNISSLHLNRITHIISLLEDNETSLLINKDLLIQYHKIEMKDSEEENLLEKLSIIIPMIDTYLHENNKNRILVHCVAGRSRSATAIIGWFMFKNKLNFTEAFDRVKNIRPWIQPHPIFLKNLQSINRKEG